MPFACPNLLGLTRLWYSSSRCETVLSGQRGRLSLPRSARCSCSLAHWRGLGTSSVVRNAKIREARSVDRRDPISPLHQQRRGSLEGSIGPCGVNGVAWQSARSAKSIFLSLPLSLANENGWTHSQLKLKPDTEYVRKPADVPLEKLFENSEWTRL